MEESFKLEETSEHYNAFETHLDETDLNSKIRTGELIRGKIAINRNNVEEATVRTKFGFEIKIVGLQNLNRCIHGDFVAIELLEESQWLEAKTLDLVDDDGALDDDKSDNRSQKTAATETKEFKSLVERVIKMGLCPTGKVNGIVRRDLRNLAGQMKRIVKIGGVDYSEIGPVDPRYPNTLLLLADVPNIRKINFLGKKSY